MDVRCCGGGGLLQAENNELRMAIARRRVGQAEDAGAGILTSACPACKLALSDAVKEAAKEIEVIDITGLAARQLGLS